MDEQLDITKMTEEDLRALCLAAVYLCISRIDQYEDPLWSSVADEAFRRGWTKAQVQLASDP